MKTLQLTLKAQYFNEILSGAKKEEYREVKWYWARRLLNFYNGDDWYLSDIDELMHELKHMPGHFNDFKSLVEFFDIDTRKFDTVTFKNGYSKNAPTMVVECLGIDVGINIQTPLGTRNFFVIKLGNILETANLKATK